MTWNRDLDGPYVLLDGCNDIEGAIDGAPEAAAVGALLIVGGEDGPKDGASVG